MKSTVLLIILYRWGGGGLLQAEEGVGEVNNKFLLSLLHLSSPVCLVGMSTFRVFCDRIFRFFPPLKKNFVSFSFLNSKKSKDWFIFY